MKMSEQGNVQGATAWKASTDTLTKQGGKEPIQNLNCVFWGWNDGRLD